MNARQLKNAILQQAIEGRLVPQHPDDEPAAVLLERIRAEKARLVAAGKVRKQKPLPPVSEEEKPFALPNGWEWVRLGEIVINRDSERIPLSVTQREQLEKIYDYYGASGVIDKVDKFIFDKRLLLVGEDGANLLLRSKPIAFFASGKFWVNNHAHVLDGTESSFLDYICLYINSVSLTKYVTGTAQPKMNQEKMNLIPVAFPPLAEQKRIVAKLEEILPDVEAYGQAQEALDALEAALPERLRKSLLQAAMQGRLVPQNPDDEPAAVLLERIRAEKARLVAAGKVRKQKPLPPVSEAEKPFALPNGWEWVRLGDVFHLQAGKFISAENITEQGKFPCFGGNGLRGFVSVFNNEGIFPLIGRQGALCGNVNIACGKFYATEHAIVVNHYNVCDPYCVGFFLSALNLNKYATATAQPGLAVATINQVLFPLPPLAEQKRIVAKLEELLPLYRGEAQDA